MITVLAGRLNAEIVLGTISNIKDAVTWLGYTYLYIRMRINPETYGIDNKDLKEDPKLLKWRTNLIHTAATLLDRHNLIKYDVK